MASGKLASLILKISANGADAQAEFKKLEKQVGDFGKKMKQIGTNMSTYITAPVVAAGALAVRSANTQIQAESRLLTALKGRKDVQERLIAQAAELQQRSTYGDEEIIAQQAYLAALGLTEAQIGSTISAATQLSAALGIDLNSAVRNLAKTYSGLAGELGESIPALRELTAEEMKAGGAIAYVNDNYKGFAETAAQTGMGPLQQLKNTLGDLAEQFGAVLVPVIQKLATKLKEIAERFQQLSPRAREVITTIAAVVAAVGPLLVAGGKFLTLAKGVVAFLPALAGGFSAILGPVAAVTAGIVAATTALLQWKNGAKMTRDEFIEWANERGTDKWYNMTMTSFGSASDAEVKRALREAEADIDALLNGGWHSDNLENVKRLSGTITALRDIMSQRSESEPAVVEEVVELTDTATKAIGLIPQLEEKIQNLNEALKAATSESAIARINADLAETNKELQRLKNLQPAKIIQQVAGISTEGVDLSGLTAPPTLKEGTLLENVFGNIQADAYTAEAEKKAEEIAEVNNKIKSILSDSFSSLATSLGEGIGNALTGDSFNPLKSFLEMFGSLLKQLGSALIAYGAALEGFKEALKSLNPWVAIAAGVAAVAAGTFVTKIAKKPIKLATGGLAYGPTLAVVGDNPGAAADPEVVAPLSKLRNYIGGQKLELVGDISFELSGDSLKAVLNRENVRLSTLG